MDFMLYSMIIARLMTTLGMSKALAGGLNSVTLMITAAGGLLFGFAADRIGRVRALIVSMVVYSLASGGSGLAMSVVGLAVFRLILGLGYAGGWTTGAVLVAESWRPEHRGKALGFMQSAFAIGEMLAVVAAALLLPRYGWRPVFFAGMLPLLAVFWISRRVPESPVWQERAEKKPASLSLLWRKDVRRNGIIATAMNTCTLFGYWGLFTWIPAYLSLPVASGGRGLNQAMTAWWLIVLGVGKWFGYVLFGFMADAAGRRRTYVSFLLIAAVLVPVYGMARSPLWLLILGPFVAFFGTGYFSGYAAIVSELFPTEIRGTAMGVSFNFGRALSGIAPAVIGGIADRHGLGYAFIVLAGAFFAAAMLALMLPETKGKHLD